MSAPGLSVQPAGIDARASQIRELIGHEEWRRLFGGSGYGPWKRGAGMAEARTLVWRILRRPARPFLEPPSYPEVAAVTGCSTHTTVLASSRRRVRRESLPAWCGPAWSLAETLGMVEGGSLREERPARSVRKLRAEGAVTPTLEGV